MASVGNNAPSALKGLRPAEAEMLQLLKLNTTFVGAILLWKIAEAPAPDLLTNILKTVAMIGVAFAIWRINR